MNFSLQFLNECKKILDEIPSEQIEEIANVLAFIRNNNGRLFIIGSGGGAGHASHAVCDFRKLCNLETYAPYDNISEMTARINDDGWNSSISNWLKESRLNEKDCLLVFSVGGGDEKKKISANIVEAIKHAKTVGAKITGIVGKEGGYTKIVGDAVIVIPVVNNNHITPLTEGFQAVIWHLLVSHPKLQQNKTKWESVN